MSCLPERVLVKKDGRMTIPKAFREELGIKEGTLLQLERMGEDKILVTALEVKIRNHKQ